MPQFQGAVAIGSIRTEAFERKAIIVQQGGTVTVLDRSPVAAITAMIFEKPFLGPHKLTQVDSTKEIWKNTMSEKQSTFTVTDRRKFTLDG